MEESKEEKPKKKMSRWKISTFVLIGVIILILVFRPGFTGSAVMSKEEAAEKAINYLNDNLLITQKATLLDVKEENNLYKVDFIIGDNDYSSYVSKDGNLLFPTFLDLNTELELPQQPEQAPQQRVEVSVDDDPVKGEANAPVTIVEFSDFQCPFCGRFRTQTFDLIKENYIDTGKVRFVYRDFPLSSIHQFAQKAAEAAECADEQGKFWEYHDRLFENQNLLSVDSLKQYAEDLGLDTVGFNDCLDSGKMEAEVQKDLSDGQSYGITGTPAFFVNGILITGAQPFSEFEQVIEEELQ